MIGIKTGYQEFWGSNLSVKSLLLFFRFIFLLHFTISILKYRNCTFLLFKEFCRVNKWISL